MNSKILVTGGAGYLGSILVPHLLSLGHEVKVIDRFLFEGAFLDCCYDEKLVVIKGDARDQNLIREHSKDADFILPLAALVGAPICDRDKIGATSINRDAIKTLVKETSLSQKIIIPITNSGYGIGESGRFCTEKSPLKPISLYGKTKVEAEEIALSRGNAISLRLATVFGVAPRMRLDLLVNDFVQRAVQDQYLVIFEGHFKRNYIHVRDVARAFSHAIQNFDSMKDEPYNVGLSEANLSKIELCEKIKNQIPGFVYIESEIGQDPDKRDYIVSNEKIESTDYKPAFTLDMGIKELKKLFEFLSIKKFSNI